MNYHFSPKLSVVIITPDKFDTIRKTIDHIKAQNVKDQLEIVIVAPSETELNLNPLELKDFLRFRIIEVGEIKSMGHALAAGVRESTAPIVVFTEDHGFPEPGWAEALIEAHRQPWAVIGPVIHNANPDSMVSWADILIGYAPWLAPNPGGIMDHLPGHHSSYKLKILQDYGSDLENLLDAETLLHWDLRSKGYKVYLEPAAKIFHLNFGTLSSFTEAHFYNGRIFAATRSKNWPRLTQVVFTFLSVMTPLLRLYRILCQIRQSGNQKIIRPFVYPLLIFGLCVSTVGEMIGYALGEGNTKKKFKHFHFHRTRHI